MKKNGFTLAEVLIVLGIIGVVAALTLPSLISDTATAQIGPKLAKSVAMFDQASSAMLTEQGVDSVLDSEIANATEYVELLTNHLKASEADTHSVTGGGSSCSGLIGSFENGIGLKTKDGVLYSLNFSNNIDTDEETPAHKKTIGTVYIDINGDSKPNIAGTDVFAFSWWADGSLKPAGADALSTTDTSGSNCSYKNACPHADSDGNYQTVTDYWACAGHIFENNLKVQYE